MVVMPESVLRPQTPDGNSSLKAPSTAVLPCRIHFGPTDREAIAVPEAEDSCAAMCGCESPASRWEHGEMMRLGEDLFGTQVAPYTSAANGIVATSSGAFAIQQVPPTFGTNVSGQQASLATFDGLTNGVPFFIMPQVPQRLQQMPQQPVMLMPLEEKAVPSKGCDQSFGTAAVVEPGVTGCQPALRTPAKVFVDLSALKPKGESSAPPAVPPAVFKELNSDLQSIASPWPSREGAGKARSRRGAKRL